MLLYELALLFFTKRIVTYKFNPTQHSTKIKAGLLKAKQAGKKLGRPKSEKIKGEDEVIRLYNSCHPSNRPKEKPYIMLAKYGYNEIANDVGVSKSTVQKIINKYKQSNAEKN